MNVILFPDIIDTVNTKEQKGPVLRFLDKLKKERPDLWTLVYQTMDKVRNASDLTFLVRQKWVEKLKGTKLPIWEFRIPPQKRGGVVRSYFAYKKNCQNTIIILSVEKKQGKSEANKDDIQRAEKRDKEVCI